MLPWVCLYSAGSCDRDGRCSVQRQVYVSYSMEDMPYQGVLSLSHLGGCLFDLPRTFVVFFHHTDIHSVIITEYTTDHPEAS